MQRISEEKSGVAERGDAVERGGERGGGGVAEREDSVERGWSCREDAVERLE